HPDLHWSGGTLTLTDTDQGPSPFKITLGPDGVVLMPSIFNWPRVSPSRATSTQTIMLYPARGAATVWEGGAWAGSGWAGVPGGPAPACPADGVVIAVGATGVCRSDWHAWKGHDPVVLPHIGGHEFAGVIVTAGLEVTAWHAGDRVTVPFACGCGLCEHCLAGDAQVCPRQTQPGFTGPGAFAELVAGHAADANPVAPPADLDFVTTACLGCRFATAFRAVTAHGRVQPGDWLAVHGCGGVGLSAVM